MCVLPVLRKGEKNVKAYEPLCLLSTKTETLQHTTSVSRFKIQAQGSLISQFNRIEVNLFLLNSINNLQRNNSRKYNAISKWLIARSMYLSQLSKIPEY